MEAQVLTITFFGHRDTKETPELKDKLNDTISFFFNLALEQNRKLKFLCGHYGNFDALSSLSIDKIRKESPSVECEKIFVTPYFGDRLDTWVASHYDSTIYPPLEKVPYKYAIVKEMSGWQITPSILYYIAFTLGVERREWKHTQSVKIKKLSIYDTIAKCRKVYRCNRNFAAFN